MLQGLVFPCLCSYDYNISYCTQIKDVVVEVIEGDARNVLCEAVERHHASVLVVGSHGYGAIKRYSFIHVFICD